MSEPANAGQIEAWNGECGARWVATADRRDQVLGPVGDDAAVWITTATRPADT